MSPDQGLSAALSGRYEIEEEIDRGGMATVFRAHDVKHDRTVAIKVLKPELAAAIGADRFLREIRTAANLSHPHILPLHDSGEAAGFLFFVMPFVRGESLRDRLEREPQLPVEEAVQLAREVADALAYAHEEGVVHRDVKPANIMLERGHALLADFGIAQAKAGAEETRLTTAGMSPGTPSYMSPEQITGDGAVDGRSDQYALSCVLFEMLAGHPPFAAPGVDTVLRQHLAVDAPLVTDTRSSTPEPVSHALNRGLAKNPADRFPTMEAFREALEGAPDSLPGQVEKPGQYRTALVAAVALVLIGAAVFLGKPWTWSGQAPPAPAGRPFTVLVEVEGTASERSREAIAFHLETELNKGHPVQTIPDREMIRMRGLMDLPDTARLSRERAQDLATRWGASTLTIPRLDEIDGAYVLALRVEDRSSGTQVAGATGRAASGAEVLDMVQDVVWEVQEALGATPEALEATRRFPEVTTPSLEALQLYLEGRNLTWQGSPQEAVPILREAVTHDTTFAMAWQMLGMAYSRLGMRDSVRAANAQRDRYPERLSDARRADVEFQQDRARDIALWDQAYERFEQNVVRGIREGGRETYWSNYSMGLMEISWVDSAYATSMQGHARHVADLRTQMPSAEIWYMCHQVPFVNSTVAAGATGRMEAYLAFMDSLDLRMHPACRDWADFASSIGAGDWNRADSLFKPLREAIEAEPLLANLEGVVESMGLQLGAVRGRIREQHRTRVEAEGRTNGLILELVYGLPQADGEEAPVELAGRGLEAVFDFTLHGTRAALLGDTLEAARILRRLQAMRDSATSTRFERAFAPWFALIEAGPAYQAQDWSRLIGVLGPLEAVFREPGFGFARGDTYLVWWLLAQAYEGVGRRQEAIACLEAMIGLPRYRGSDIFRLGLAYPAAQLKLGRLYREIGDAALAARSLRDFLSVFTDPEPEFQWMVEEAEVDRGSKGPTEPLSLAEMWTRWVGRVKNGRWGGVLGAAEADCGFPGAPQAGPEGPRGQASQL